MHSKSLNIQVMTYDIANEVIKKSFESLLSVIILIIIFIEL